MFKIFELTRKQLDMYVGKGMDSLYNSVTRDTKNLWEGGKRTKKQISEIIDLIKK